jgi:hypothetical protein
MVFQILQDLLMSATVLFLIGRDILSFHDADTSQVL